jgi:two-component system chemotaxis sensor kinase CheA
MDPMAEIRLTFFQECEEQLSALENGLLSMQEGESDSETVNAVFRAVHSIKGGAGAFKLDALVSFAHIFETALDKVRSGQLVPDADAMKLFLRAADALADLVSASRDGAVEDTAPYVAIEEEFNALIGGGGAAEAEDDFAGLDFQPIITAFDEPAPALNRFTIRFRPLRELYAKANEPLALFRELSRLGMLTQRVLHSSHVRDREVTSSLEELERLTREIQESVMAIRAQPVRPLFQRMSRIVREVAAEVK